MKQPLDLCAQKYPDRYRRQVHQTECHGHYHGGQITPTLWGKVGHRINRHGDSLWVDPLKSGCLQKCKRFARCLCLAWGRSCGNFPGKIQKIKAGAYLHAKPDIRISRKNLPKAKPNYGCHKSVSEGNSKHVRDGAHKSIICTRCHQHEVIRPGGRRAHKSKAN